MFADAPRSFLTNLTRLAKRQPAARLWLEQALPCRLSFLAEVAVEVAVETGDPIGLILARQFEQSHDADLLARIVARCNETRSVYSVPIQEVALAAARRLLTLRREMWTSIGRAHV